jgi:hypothetical protein
VLGALHHLTLFSLILGNDRDSKFCALRNLKEWELAKAVVVCTFLSPFLFVASTISTEMFDNKLLEA